MALPSDRMFTAARKNPALASYRSVFDQPARTANVIGGAVNPYLGDYAASLTDDQERRAFEQAKQIVRQNRQTERQGNAASLLAGSGNWRQFDDYAAVRGQTEALLGRKFGIGGIQGGDDINQRPIDGMGDTLQIGGSSAEPRVARGGEGGMRNRANVSAVDRALSVYDPYQSVNDHAAESRARQTGELALRALRRKDQLDEANLLSGLAGRAEAGQWAEGTPNARNRADVDALQATQHGIDRGRAQSRLASENYWQREEPIARYKQGQQELAADRAGDRALALQDSKNQAALTAALGKLQIARDANEAKIAMNELRALASRAGNMTQYGADTTALDQEFASRIMGGGSGGASRGPGAEGIRGTRIGEKLSDGRETWEWDGRDWKLLQ